MRGLDSIGRMTDENETQDERQNRELIELLNELRVVLPGVQVLFAFLLTIAFSSKFGTIDNLERATYMVAFFSTALTSVLLMTPTVFHRIRFRKGDKETLLRLSNRFALTAMGCLSVAMVSVIWLVSELVLSQATANLIAVVSAVTIVGLWFAIPVWRELHDHR
jgi:hypothetical protein